MLRRLTPSPTMAVALLALFVALAGGAYAQANLPANSVGTGQLRNGAVTHPKLANNSVWHANLGTRSVRNGNLATNSVWHAQLGGGVVRRNNMSAPLLAELGSTRTVFDEGGSPGAEIPVNQETRLVFGPFSHPRSSVPITTTASERTLTVQAVIHLDNRGTAASTVACGASLANNRREFFGFITAETPPAPNEAWNGQITLLGRWAVSAGTHNVALFCRPFPPPAGGTVLVGPGAQILLTAAP